MDHRRALVETDAQVSIRRQCELLDIHRSGIYYEPAPESALNLVLMRIMDEQHLQTPFYGVRQMSAVLQRKGYTVNVKRVRRLLRLMGLEAICPKPGLSKPAKGHSIYPYLLRGVQINAVNHVWSTDITYIPMAKGFMYLIAIMDWFSRYVLCWELSNTMDGSFCTDILKLAIARYGKPLIFNTDQGSQFTADAFVNILANEGVAISMDGKGRATDNVFIERLWRSLKYEYVYPNMPDNVPALYKGLEQYFRFYNNERPHSSLSNSTPEEIYLNQKTTLTLKKITPDT
jgi:putative transposase